MDVFIPNKKIKIYQKEIVRFYNFSGRKHLAWRHTKDPWKILLSEMLLRKTTVKQVEEVYDQLAALSPEELATADRAELELLLAPLGIQKERARLLLEAAKAVSEAGKDRLEEEDFLKSLPGVGMYAVSTVLCFAFGKARPALDRNMIRVLERVFSILSDKPRPHTDRRLWKAAEELVPGTEPEKYNWGVLDLAAAVCRPKKPLCHECPLKSICLYAEEKVRSEAEAKQ